MEYPAEVFLSETADASVSDVQIWADFRGARLDERLAEQDFAIASLEGDHPVSAFHIPPPPLPTRLFNKRPQPFSFQTQDGQRLTQEMLQGKPTVLLWFNDHPLGKSAVEQLGRIRDACQDELPVEFVAVCTEPSSLSTEELARRMNAWGTNLPWVRDLDACGRDVFQIPWAPTLVVLDAEGVVQAFEVGFDPVLEEALPLALRRLLGGANLAAEILERQAEAERVYTSAVGP